MIDSRDHTEMQGERKGAQEKKGAKSYSDTRRRDTEERKR